MTAFKRLLIVFILCLIPIYSFSATIYICDTSVCGNTPTSPYDTWAKALDDFSVTAVRGNTYYIARGSYAGDKKINVPLSGTPTDYITIKAATVADHGTDTGWDNGYAVNGTTNQAVFTGYIYFENYGYIVFSGNTSSGVTGVGTYGFKIVPTDDEFGIFNRYGPTHITIKDVEIDMTPTTFCVSNSADIKGIQGSGSPDYITLTNVKVTNEGDAISTQGANTIYEYLYITREDNHNNPTGYCDSTDHGDAIVLANANNVTIRNSIFNWNGQQIYFTGTYSNDSIYVYGNVQYVNGTAGASACAVHLDSAGPTVTNLYYYQNTVYNMYSSIHYRTGSTLTGVARNNLYINVTSVPAYGSMTHDYNASNVDLSEDHDQVLTSSIFTDAASYDLTLSGGTDAGATLGSPYNIDKAGNTRTTPDRGAYEYDTGGADSTAPTLAEVTPVSTPSINQSPSYVFSTDEACVVSYSGDCGNGTLINASVGNNTTNWSLVVGTYSNCGLVCTDGANNASSSLSVTEFVITPTTGVPMAAGGGCTFSGSLP